jgi:nucleoside-diphosphate kinase
MQHLKQERTLVLVKPDGVKRGLVGEVVSRIERRGLKVIAMRMVQVDRAHLEEHFPKELAWVERIGGKSLKTFEEYGIDPVAAQGTSNPAEIGAKVKESLFSYMQSGPIVAMVIEGIHAITMVRKIAGHTLPNMAEMGTVRGDYSVDSPAVANLEGRAIHNIMHASETPEESANEIGLWFKPEELHSYIRAEEDVMF